MRTPNLALPIIIFFGSGRGQRRAWSAAPLTLIESHRAIIARIALLASGLAFEALREGIYEVNPPRGPLPAD